MTMISAIFGCCVFQRGNRKTDNRCDKLFSPIYKVVLHPVGIARSVENKFTNAHLHPVGMQRLVENNIATETSAFRRNATTSIEEVAFLRNAKIVMRHPFLPSDSSLRDAE